MYSFACSAMTALVAICSFFCRYAREIRYARFTTMEKTMDDTHGRSVGHAVYFRTGKTSNGLCVWFGYAPVIDVFFAAAPDKREMAFTRVGSGDDVSGRYPLDNTTEIKSKNKDAGVGRKSRRYVKHESGKNTIRTRRVISAFGERKRIRVCIAET